MATAQRMIKRPS